jgi:hypothetical protein
MDGRSRVAGHGSPRPERSGDDRPADQHGNRRARGHRDAKGLTPSRNGHRRGEPGAEQSVADRAERGDVHQQDARDPPAKHSGQRDAARSGDSAVPQSTTSSARRGVAIDRPRMPPRPSGSGSPRTSASASSQLKAEASAAGSRCFRVPEWNATSHAHRRDHDCPSAPAIQQSGGADHGRRPPLATNSSVSKHKSSSLPGLARTAATGVRSHATSRHLADTSSAARQRALCLLARRQADLQQTHGLSLACRCRRPRRRRRRCREGQVAPAPELAVTRRPLRQAKRQPVIEDRDVRPRDLHACARPRPCLLEIDGSANGYDCRRA